MAVRVGDALPALPRPRAFDLSQGGRRSVSLSGRLSAESRKSSLTSSLVVTLEATRYVWKPDRPRMDQTDKKQIASSTAVGGVKEHKRETLRPPAGLIGFVRTILVPTF